MAARIELHPAAIVEAASARRWYADRNRAVASAFLDELDRVIARLADDPSSLPIHRHGTRRCAFRRFPYMLVFRERQGAVQIVAVAHARRGPDYWRRRLGN